MGAYLSQPNTVKCSGDGVGAPRLPLPYGFSAMQGWRVSMEGLSAVPADLELTFVAQAGLELPMILLPQPPECWDYKHEPPRPALIKFLVRPHKDTKKDF